MLQWKTDATYTLHLVHIDKNKLWHVSEPQSIDTYTTLIFYISIHGGRNK